VGLRRKWNAVHKPGGIAKKKRGEGKGEFKTACVLEAVPRAGVNGRWAEMGKMKEV